jgi:hypothetical protein
MKACLALLLSASGAFAQSGLFLAAAQSGAATVVCVSNTSWGSAATTIDFAKATTTKYGTSSNALASAATACAIWMNFKRVGVGTAGTLTGEIRANSSGLPGDVLYTSANTIASGAVATNAAAWYEFQFSNVSLAASTIYWFGVVSSTINSTNYYVATVGAFNGGYFATDDNASGWGNAGARKWFQSLWSNGSTPLFPYTNSTEFHLTFETGDDGDQVTTSAMSNSVVTQPPLSVTRYEVSGTASNSFFLSSWATTLTNHYRDNFLTSGGTTRGLAISHDSTNFTYLIWHVTNNPSRVLSFGYYVCMGLTNDEVANFESLYFSSTFTSSNCSAIPLYMPRNPPYWMAHGISNAVTVNGPPIYGIAEGDTNWVTGQITATNFTISVWKPSDWSQIGSNSTLGLGGDTLWRTIRVDNNWSQLARTSYVDNLVVTTNAIFPLLPSNLPAILNVQMRP